MGLLSHHYTIRMGRWEEGARERLVLAAVDLFTEKGYDETTVTELAERAGVTRSTFFRYFPDKRDILVAGQETLSILLTEGIADAPAGATPLAAVASGLERISSAMGPVNRELGPRVKAAVAASKELQEREMMKHVSLTSAVTGALVARGVALPVAQVAAELGLLAFARGWEEWTVGDRDSTHDLAHYMLPALEELRAASAALG